MLSKSAEHSGVRPSWTFLAIVAGAFLLLLATAGCAKPAQGKAPTAVPVSVSQVACRQFQETSEFTGRLEAIQNVEVRPRVSGYLESVNFAEGAIVQQGSLLFQIDPRPFQAEVDRLKGELSEAKAELARAQSDFERAERLHNNNGMSAEEYDRRSAARNQAQARISATEAALKGAQLNLEFTRITAPITGRVSRAEITAGNLVASGPQQVKPLTTMVSLAPIYAYFDVDEQTFLRFSRVSSPRSAKSHSLAREVNLALANEEGWPHKGRLDFVDNQVSPNTGTIRVRAVFTNQDLSLTPGLFARVKLAGAEQYRGCLARDEAISTDLNQKYVLALGKNNTLEYRPVQLGPVVDGLRVVRDGLQPGDVIVVNGIQRVRPGAVVSPSNVEMRPQPEAGKPATTSMLSPQ